jgi:hypothetical protein
VTGHPAVVDEQDVGLVHLVRLEHR